MESIYFKTKLFIIEKWEHGRRVLGMYDTWVTTYVCVFHDTKICYALQKNKLRMLTLNLIRLV